MGWIDTVVQGILLGGLFALFALGLAVIYGVMKLINIAHGDFIVLGAYLSLGIIAATGLHPIPCTRISSARRPPSPTSSAATIRRSPSAAAPDPWPYNPDREEGAPSSVPGQPGCHGRGPLA